jgi:LacI family transcriptional regulator
VCDQAGAAAFVRAGTVDPAHGARATAELLDVEGCTAVIAGSNQLLPGVIEELHRRGVRIGADVSLLACDSVPLSEFLTPPMAVIRRDAREMGAVAASLLLEQLDGARPRSVVLPVEFAPAASCGPAPKARRRR